METKSQSTETFLQKLLGNNYKYFYFIRFSFISVKTGWGSFLISQISDLLQNISIAYIWILANSNSQTITYLIIGRIYKALSDTFYGQKLGGDISNGGLTSTLMYPRNTIVYCFLRQLGARIFWNSNIALTYLITILIYLQHLVLGSFDKFLILLFLLPITHISIFLLEFLIGCSAFFLKDKRDFDGVYRAYSGITGILSGVLIPLDKLPFNLGYYFSFLPTSWLLHHPMQIYLGKYSPIETFWVFLGGIFWCVFLYFLAKLVFKMGLKKNESVGL